jgi:hypothetical protein
MSTSLQSQLTAALERRVQASGFENLAALTQAEPSDDVSVCVVLSDFDLESYVKGTLEFLGCSPERDLGVWYRCFTKTVFLLGQPSRLRARHAFGFVATNGLIAWSLPCAKGATADIRRQLKSLHTEQTVQVPPVISLSPTPTGGHRIHISIDIRDLSVEEYLVHLNHTLCEAFIEGHLSATSSIVVNNAGALDELPARWLYQRIQRDPRDPTKLRRFACVHLQDTHEGSP